MSPVNNDPSSGASSGGMPLTRKELRARERFLATQNQNVVPVPEATPGEAGASAEAEPELPRPVPAVPNAAGAQRTFAAPLPAVPPVPDAAPASAPEPVAPESEAARESVAATEDSTTHIPAVVHAYAGHVDADASTGSRIPDRGQEQFHGEADHQGPTEPEVHTVHDVQGDDEVHDVHPDHEGHEVHPDHGIHAEHGVVADHEIHADHPDHGIHADHPDHGVVAADGIHPDHAGHYDYEEHHEVHPDDHHGLHGEHEHELLPAVETPVSKAAARKARRRRRVLALLITLGVFVAAIAIGAQFLKPLLGMDKVTDYPGPGTGSVTVTVPEGAGPKQVAADLASKKVVADADSFVKAFVAEGGVLSPGDFTFKTEMKNSDAVAILSNKDASKVIYFALSAGLRINESLDAISKGSGIPIQQLNAFNQAPGQFGLPAKAKNLEGFLAPGEYRFPLGTSGKDIIQSLVKATLDELKAQGVTDPAKQYDVVTIASIVQAEGGQADYGNVAGAIYNRLKPDNKETNGLIQSDATVTYGLGKKSFHLTDEEKADKSNTYNTYANVGLPAGPIGSPGKTAIDAAAKPTPNDYLYWVTINLDTKETKFSKTLAEHNTYVEQYNAWCAANAGRCV